jgi:sensor histidine kinase regulating citrate/malate metabolism
LLSIMLINAFEASKRGGLIKLWLEEGDEALVFCVWSQGIIPEEVRPRLFQRNFSTKNGLGRGMGSYAMKLFGERFLGGTVEFTSTERDGTVFRFAHPLR